MTTRTTTRTVTFTKPFRVAGFDEELPPGTYEIETDEELVEGITFPVYRRILTIIHLHAMPGHPGRTQMVTIDPDALDAALQRDRETVS